MTTRQLELNPTESDRSDQPAVCVAAQSDPAFCRNGSDIDNLLEGTLAGQLTISVPLTRREKQILQSILAGLTNKQIARSMCRSRRTIEYHRHRLMLKLNAHSTAELVKGAIAMGLACQGLTIDE